MSAPLDDLRQLADGTRPPPPITALIGFTLSAVSPGKAVVELAAGRQHANPMGALHEGVLCDIADAAMGIAYASMLGDGETFATVELKVNFLKTAKPRATGRIVKRGQTLGFLECDITDEHQSLVARASSTCMTLHGEPAHGR